VSGDETVAVVGAGVFGAWSALKLTEAGYRVTLIDAYGPANGRASSADHSRVIRAGYGRDAIYSEWAAAALVDWAALQRETGVPILAITGALFLGPPDHGYISDTFTTLTTIGRRVERLAAEDLASRFPVIAIDGLGDAVYEPDAGVLRARAGVQAAVRLATSSRGVAYRTARIAPLDEQRTTVAVRCADGSRLHADHFVFACGPWLPQLFPEAAGPRIRATRQEVLYYGVPAGDDRFSSVTLPVWIDFAAGLYGIPDLDGAGFKIGIDRHGDPVDPDTLDRVVEPTLVNATRAWLRTRFPGLGPAPLVDARVCQYENSATGDFIIDRHPAWPNVWIVGGGSGHGFKHGPSVARHVVERLRGAPAETRFALTGAKTAGRTVY
jgi:sarcosine oxidase